MYVIKLNILYYLFQNAYIVHMFPPCDYINSVLTNFHPSMVKQIETMAHLIIVIATV